MVATRRLKELISAALPKLELPDGRLIVALSGGADSASLAFLTLEAGREVAALHVNHQLPASPQLAKAARVIAAKLEIPIEISSVSVGSGPSPEEQARIARYQVLCSVNAPVLTGHTRDDSIETLLINLVRGTGSAGLVGIPRFRPPNITRPILDLTRSETREIATLAGLPFFDDPMNVDMALTRNRIRLEVLPLLRSMNPGVESALTRTATILARDLAYLDRLTPGLSDNTVAVSVLLTLPRPLSDRILHGILERADLSPTADRMERMWSVAVGSSDRQDLAAGRVVARRGALLIVE